MDRLLLSFVLLLVCTVSYAANVHIESVDDATGFLEKREVLCSVLFEANSSELTADARSILEEKIAALKAVDPDKKLIRIEGFASPDGDRQSNFRLSIARARAVESFLRVRHGVSLEHYIAGFGPVGSSHIDAAGTRSVEIAIYDNPWNQVDIPVKMSGGGD